MRDDLLDLARRRFLSRLGAGFAGLALTDLLRSDASAEDKKAWKPGLPQFAPRAKQVLQIFWPGGASHMDLWDYKPELEKRDGQPLPGEENLVSFQGKNGPLMRSPWEFAPAGRSGKKISSMLPNMAAHVDDI